MVGSGGGRIWRRWSDGVVEYVALDEGGGCRGGCGGGRRKRCMRKRMRFRNA